MILPLLQTIQIFSKPDPKDNIIAISVIAGFLVVFLGWSLITMRISNKPGTYSRRTFRNRAKKLGLTKDHIGFLEKIIKETKFLSPNRALENSQAIDSLLRKAMSSMESQENISAQEKEQRKHLIYQIKQTIEANSQQFKIISSTLSLPINTEVTIRTKDGKTYASFITSNMQNMLGLECPACNERGKEYPWPKAEALGIVFIRGGLEVYAFKTKVLGYKRVRGVISVFVEHGKNLKQIQKRKSKRKEITRPALFYPVEIMETGKGRKAVRQAVVNNNRRVLGSLQDISAGGCAILTKNPLPKAALVKVDFETARGKSVTAYGKVKGMSSVPPRGGIMHVQFTNVTRLNLNKIRDYVYEYIPQDES
jgi:c-di-GMP-binding flagellar brake protein YcgR